MDGNLIPRDEQRSMAKTAERVTSSIRTIPREFGPWEIKNYKVTHLTFCKIELHWLWLALR
jgi:hypothetical protein